jgi:hypothetical protein
MFNEPHATSGSKVMVDFLIGLVSLSYYLHILKWSKKNKKRLCAVNQGRLCHVCPSLQKGVPRRGGEGGVVFEPFGTAILTGFVRIVDLLWRWSLEPEGSFRQLRI